MHTKSKTIISNQKRNGKKLEMRIDNLGNRNRVPVLIIEGANHHAIRTAGVLKLINQIYISKLAIKT